VRHFIIGLLDLLEAAGNITTGDLHPEVPHALQSVNLTVLQLLDHVLSIVPNTVECGRNLFVALSDLHGRNLLPYHFIEHRRVIQGPGNGDGLFRIQVADPLDHGHHRGFVRLVRHEPQITQFG